MDTSKLVAETMVVLKRLLKERGHTYADLAKHLGLSLPAVKRAMTANEMPLSRVYAICAFLRVDLHDILRLQGSHRSRLFEFSLEQEEFLAKHPNYMAYLYELHNGQLSPQQIEAKHGISHASTRAYLKKLAVLGLLSYNSDFRVTLNTWGVLSFSDHGILGRTYSTQMIKAFARRAVAKIGAPQNMFLQLQRWYMTPENYREFQKEFLDFSTKYRQLSTYNRKILRPEEYSSISSMFVADDWYESPYRNVTEL